MSFFYPTQSSSYPILILTNSDDDDDDDEEDPFSSSNPIPITCLPNFIQSTEPNQYRIRLNVEGFQANDMNIFIQNDRIIVHGKHFTQTTTTNNLNDNESDFVAKEFKRTFHIPSNVDIKKAHAQFYTTQQLLIIEIPFQNCLIRQNPRRSINVFLTFVTILLIDRAIRITYEQFMLNQY